MCLNIPNKPRYPRFYLSAGKYAQISLPHCICAIKIIISNLKLFLRPEYTSRMTMREYHVVGKLLYHFSCQYDHLESGERLRYSHLQWLPCEFELDIR